MSSTNSPDSSRGMKSQSVPQGTFMGDQMWKMHQADPKSMQSPSKTMAKLSAIFNTPDCVCAAVGPKQAAINNDR